MFLITPEEIILFAFSQRETIKPENIRYSSIDVAQERYIAPRLGYELFDQICDNRFPDFTAGYLKTALSHYVRYMLLDDLLIQIDDRGCINFTGKTSLISKTGDDTISDVRTQTDTSNSDMSKFESQDLPGSGTSQEDIIAEQSGTDTRTADSSSTTAENYDTYIVASNAQIHKLQVRTLADANTLMNKAIRYIENNETIFGKFKGSARHYF